MHIPKGGMQEIAFRIFPDSGLFSTPDFGSSDRVTGGGSKGGTESPEARPGIREAEAPQQGAVRPRAQG